MSTRPSNGIGGDRAWRRRWIYIVAICLFLWKEDGVIGGRTIVFAAGWVPPPASFAAARSRRSLSRHIPVSVYPLGLAPRRQSSSQEASQPHHRRVVGTPSTRPSPRSRTGGKRRPNQKQQQKQQQQQQPQKRRSVYNKNGKKNNDGADFPFLRTFPSASDIDNWMVSLAATARISDRKTRDNSTKNSTSLPAHHNTNYTTNRQSHLPTRSELSSQRYSSHQQVALCRALATRGARQAALLYTTAIVHSPISVYLATAALRYATTTWEEAVSVLDALETTTTSTSRACPSSYTLTALVSAVGRTPDDVRLVRDRLVARYTTSNDKNASASHNSPNSNNSSSSTCRMQWTPFVWEAAVYACAPPLHHQRRQDGAKVDNTDKAVATAFELYHTMLDEQGDTRSSSSSTTRQQSHHHRHGRERVHAALLHVCARTRRVDKAVELWETLDDPSRTPRLWGAMLKVCVDDWRRAHAVLRDFSKRKNHQPNVRHGTAYLKALIAGGEIERAAAFLRYMMLDGGTKQNPRHGSSATAVTPTTTKSLTRNDAAVSEEWFHGLRACRPDMIAVKTVLHGCATSVGNFAAARQILNDLTLGFYGEILRRQVDEQCYDMALSACDDPVLAQSLMDDMRTLHHTTGSVRPGKFTYTRAITCCRKAKDVSAAWSFLLSARADGIPPDVFIYSSAIWTAAEAGNATAAWDMLQEMQIRGTTPNLVSYNGVLAALSACGQVDDAVALFRAMRQAELGYSADFVTFYHLAGAVRRVSANEEKVALLWRIFTCMNAHERQAKIGGRVIEALISTYGLLGHFQEAMTVFKAINGPSDAECLRAVLFACSLADPPRWEIALELLHSSDIVANGEGPAYMDEGALCNAMLACSKANEWAESLQLLRLYGKKSASIVAVNSLIAACGRGQRADMAVEVLNDMHKYSLVPDELSYRNAIIACNQAEHEQRRTSRQSFTSDTDIDESGFGWWECAISLLRQMKENGLSPDTAILSSTISACEAAERWQLALEILQAAMDEGDNSTSPIALNLFCFNAAIAACEKGGAWVEALEIYERMKERGGQELSPNIVTMNSLIEALDRAGQKELSVSLFEEGVRKKFLKNPWRTTIDSKSNGGVTAMDLHSYSAAMTRAAIRSHMNMWCETTDESKQPKDSLVIIVGKGLHSKEEPVLRKAVETLLKQDYGISGEADSMNFGRLIVPLPKLQELVKQRSSFKEQEVTAKEV